MDDALSGSLFFQLAHSLRAWPEVSEAVQKSRLGKRGPAIWHWLPISANFASGERAANGTSMRSAVLRLI